MIRVKPRTHQQDSLFIVYDADSLKEPDPELFDAVNWEAQGAVSGKAQGRGSALFLDTSFGELVLRQYLRGGQVARISRDRYAFTGYSKSRPVVEFEVLVRLQAAQLPVPAPLAAMCRRDGLTYQGWLLTRRIPGALPLADLLDSRGSDPELWRTVGRVIRKFHDHDLVHADLNARNILLDTADAVHLLDFDRARFSSADSLAYAANLKRLRRSLEKLWPAHDRAQLEPCWHELKIAYRQAGGES